MLYMILIGNMWAMTTIKYFLFCSTLFFSLSVYANALPDLGSPSLGYLTPAKEQALAQKFLQAILGSEKVLQDPVVSDYIQTLGKRLVRATPGKRRQFHFFVINNSAVNAFAGPGGYIGVNTGLILLTPTAGELAAVMAHEVAHVTQHHIARAIQEASQTRLPTLATILAAIAIGIANPAAGAGLMNASVAGYVQNMINFTRANEEEADRVGTGILYRAGFNPQAMPDAFKLLAMQQRLYPTDIPQFLRTHPYSQARVADTAARVARFPKKIYKKNKLFYFIQARVRVDTANNPVSSLNYFKHRLKNTTGIKQGSAEYGYALTQLHLKHFKNAQTRLRKLIKQYPKFTLLKLSLAQTEIAARQYKKGLPLLKKLYQHNPDSYPIIINYARALYESKYASEAARLLRSHKQDFPKEIDLYYLLARAQAKSGNQAGSLQTLAQLYILVGKPKAAMHQLTVALRQPHLSRDQKDMLQAQLIELKRKYPKKH